MPYETISVEPLNPVIGAEISGVNLAEPLNNQTFSEIHDALMAHQVIFFRDQDLTHDQHKAFGRLFGELHIHPTAPATEGDKEILTIHADETSERVAGEGWHSDVSCDIEPPLGSILYIRQAPKGGDTMFASTYAAYDALSEPMKRFLDGLNARHSGMRRYRDRNKRTGMMRDGENAYPEAVHPIVRTHPVTGRKGLFVNPVFTENIDGLPEKESRVLLDFLYDHIDSPAFHCRFTWRDNSIAFWDNRCVQHHAVWDYYPQVRHGYRVTVQGDRPF